MIAVVSNPKATLHHAKFVAMIPQIQRYASFVFRHEPRAAQEDLIAESIASAYVNFARLVERDKVELAFASVLARYACKQIRAGRRIGNRADIRDLLSSHARKRGVFVHGLFERDEKGNWQDLVIEDKRTRPADVAACRVDFRAWLATLTIRNRRIAEALAVGASTTEVAKRFQISPGRVSQLRNELFEEWQELHGECEVAAA